MSENINSELINHYIFTFKIELPYFSDPNEDTLVKFVLSNEDIWGQLVKIILNSWRKRGGIICVCSK